MVEREIQCPRCGEFTELIDGYWVCEKCGNCGESDGEPDEQEKPGM